MIETAPVAQRAIRSHDDIAMFFYRVLDVAWSVECTKHFFDNVALFRHADRWVKPGGRVAFCVWLAAVVHPARRLFLEHFSTPLAAYRTGAMQYDCLVDRRP